MEGSEEPSGNSMWEQSPVFSNNVKGNSSFLNDLVSPPRHIHLRRPKSMGFPLGRTDSKDDPMCSPSKYADISRGFESSQATVLPDVAHFAHATDIVSQTFHIHNQQRTTERQPAVDSLPLTNSNYLSNLSQFHNNPVHCTQRLHMGPPTHTLLNLHSSSITYNSHQYIHNPTMRTSPMAANNIIPNQMHANYLQAQLQHQLQHRLDKVKALDSSKVNSTLDTAAHSIIHATQRHNTDPQLETIYSKDTSPSHIKTLATSSSNGIQLQIDDSPSLYKEEIKDNALVNATRYQMASDEESELIADSIIEELLLSYSVNLESMHEDDMQALFYGKPDETPSEIISGRLDGDILTDGLHERIEPKLREKICLEPERSPNQKTNHQYQNVMWMAEFASRTTSNLK